MILVTINKAFGPVTPKRFQIVLFSCHCLCVQSKFLIFRGGEGVVDGEGVAVKGAYSAVVGGGRVIKGSF